MVTTGRLGQAAVMNDHIAMIITSKAASGKREELFELYTEHLAPRAEANDGQPVVVWSEDQHDPDTFYLFEIYRDAETLGANAQAQWFGEYMAAALPLMAGEPTVGMANLRWAKGID